MTEKDVMNRVREHAKEVDLLRHDFFFISAQGSWNYELGYENSDVDTKAVILPRFEEFVLNKDALSTTHILSNNEHIDLKDIRVMFKNFWKQNINFLEVLFSKYCVVNPNYQEEWEQLTNLRERIAHYNNWYAVKGMCGLATEKYAALYKPYPAQVEIVEKYGYSGKQLHHLMRMVNFLTGYVNDLSFEECLTFFPIYEKDMLMSAKRQEFSLEEVNYFANRSISQLEELRTNYLSSNPNVIDEEVKQEVEKILFKILRKKFLNELREESYDEKTVYYANA